MRKRMRRIVMPLCVGLFAVGLIGCDSGGGGGEEEPARFSDDGVDGVRFGDSLSTATRILGDFDTQGRQNRGDLTWTYVQYNAGPHTGLRIHFIRDEQGNPGPADVFSVFRSPSGAFAPYDGTTAAGIGIGSSLSAVQAAYGSAEEIAGPYHFYCLGQRDFQIVIDEDSLVEAMHIGYHRPLSDPDQQFCLN